MGAYCRYKNKRNEGCGDLGMSRSTDTTFSLLAVLRVANINPPPVKADGVDGAARLDEEIAEELGQRVRDRRDRNYEDA